MALLCIYKVMTPSPSFLRFHPQKAFSLIEVVIAIAIVSFSLVAIIGMLPVGLKSMQDSQNEQAEGTIANQLRGELEQISFHSSDVGSIQSLPSTNYFYTSEGLRINGTEGTNVSPYYKASFVTGDAAVNGDTFSDTNSLNIQVTLTYPYPVLSQTNTFNLLATRQTGL